MAWIRPIGHTWHTWHTWHTEGNTERVPRLSLHTWHTWHTVHTMGVWHTHWRVVDAVCLLSTSSTHPTHLTHWHVVDTHTHTHTHTHTEVMSECGKLPLGILKNCIKNLWKNSEENIKQLQIDSPGIPKNLNGFSIGGGGREEEEGREEGREGRKETWTKINKRNTSGLNSAVMGKESKNLWGILRESSKNPPRIPKNPKESQGNPKNLKESANNQIWCDVNTKESFRNPPRISKNPQKHRKKPRESQRIPKESQKSANDQTWFNKNTKESFKNLSRIPEDLKESQRISKNLKESQRISKNFKESRKFTNNQIWRNKNTKESFKNPPRIPLPRIPEHPKDSPSIPQTIFRNIHLQAPIQNPQKKSKRILQESSKNPQPPPKHLYTASTHSHTHTPTHSALPFPSH